MSDVRRQRPEPDRAEADRAGDRRLRRRPPGGRHARRGIRGGRERHLRLHLSPEHHADVRVGTRRPGSPDRDRREARDPEPCLHPAGHDGKTADQSDVGRRRREAVRVPGGGLARLVGLPDHRGDIRVFHCSQFKMILMNLPRRHIIQIKQHIEVEVDSMCNLCCE